MDAQGAQSLLGAVVEVALQAPPLGVSSREDARVGSLAIGPRERCDRITRTGR
jgi:hypothetical protein